MSTPRLSILLVSSLLLSCAAGDDKLVNANGNVSGQDETDAGDGASTTGGTGNAGRVDVFYMVSRDGGKTWAPPVRVNELNHALNMEEPPLGLASFDYEALGDYMQLRATGTGAQTAAYIGWTGYDQYRADDGVGAKKQRVYATRVSAPLAPAAMPWCRYSR